MSDYILINGELYHHGVKGMKWGVRRYQNKDGSLTPKGIKRYAKKGYSQDSLDSNKSTLGRVYDMYTGAHKLHGSVKYDISSKAENKARAEKYIADKKARKEEKRARIPDANIRRIEADRAVRKIKYDYTTNELKINRAQSGKNFARLKDGLLNAQLDTLKKNYDRAEAVDRYSIARNKAKKDPSYKNTEEYKEAQKAGRQVMAQDFVSQVVFGISTYER